MRVGIHRSSLEKESLRVAVLVVLQFVAYDRPDFSSEFVELLFGEPLFTLEFHLFQPFLFGPLILISVIVPRTSHP
jgi:hypothetical protein